MSIQGLLNKNMAVDRGNGIQREDAILKPMRSMWLKRQVAVIKNGNHYDVTCERHNSISEKWLEVTGSPFVFVSGGSFASAFAYLFLVPYAVGSMVVLGVTNLFMSIPLAVDLIAKKISLHGNQNAKAYQSIIEKALEYESFIRKHPNRSSKTLDQLQAELEMAKGKKEKIEHQSKELESKFQEYSGELRVQRELLNQEYNLALFNYEDLTELYQAKEQEVKLHADLKEAVENYHQLTAAQGIEEEIECEFTPAVLRPELPLAETESPKGSPELAHFKEVHTQIRGLEEGLSGISDAAMISTILASIATLKEGQNKAINELQEKIKASLKAFNNEFSTYHNTNHLHRLSAEVERHKKDLAEMETL